MFPKGSFLSPKSKKIRIFLLAYNDEDNETNEIFYDACDEFNNNNNIETIYGEEQLEEKLLKNYSSSTNNNNLTTMRYNANNDEKFNNKIFNAKILVPAIHKVLKFFFFLIF